MESVNHDFAVAPTIRKGCKEEKISIACPFEKISNMFIPDFAICPFFFLKNSDFLTNFSFFWKITLLICHETLIFRNYSQFPFQRYMICLYSLQNKEWIIFSQKSLWCPIWWSSFLETCLKNSGVRNSTASKVLTLSLPNFQGLPSDSVDFVWISFCL